jgi:hypothetical protein
MVGLELREIVRVHAECESLKLWNLGSFLVDVSLVVRSLGDRKVHCGLRGPRHGNIFESTDKEGILLRLKEKLENHHYHI